MANLHRTSGFTMRIEDLEMLCKPMRVVLVPLELEDNDSMQKSKTRIPADEIGKQKRTLVNKHETTIKKLTKVNKDKTPKKNPASVNNNKTLKKKTTSDNDTNTPKRKRVLRLKYITPDNQVIKLRKQVVFSDKQAEKYGFTDSQQCRFCSATFLDPGDFERHERGHVWNQYDPNDPIYQTIDGVIKDNLNQLNLGFKVEPYDPTEDQVLSNVEHLNEPTNLDSVEGVGSASTPIETVENVVQQTVNVNDGFCGEGSDEAGTRKRDTTAKKCEFCGIGFLHLLNLRKHLSQSHGQEESVLNGTVQLPSARKQTARPKPVHKCSQCDMTYTKLSMLKCHEKTHQGKCRYYCAECKCAYNNASILRFHMRKHTGEKPYTCSYCGISFYTQPPYANHLRIHTGLTPHACDVCGESFKTISSLKYHKSTVHDEKRLKCKSCPEEFKRASDLKTHRSQAHDILENKKFKCHLCPAAYSKSWSLKCHSASHSNERPFLCDFCPLTFKTKSVLRGHRLNHIQKSFQCTVCGKQLTTVKKYGLHMRIEHGIGKEVCDICGVATNNLISHKRVHEIPVKSLKCDLCSYVAAKPHLLKDHFIKQHTNEKPFECDVCGRAFKFKNYLITHSRTHTNVKHFQCPLCPQSYRCYVTLKKHKTTQHGENASRSFQEMEEEMIDNDLEGHEFAGAF